MEQFQRLYQIIKTLRSEDGCPWDREQNLQSMVSSLIEETYELVDAIENYNIEDTGRGIGRSFLSDSVHFLYS